MSKYKISLSTSDVTAYSYSKKGDLGNFYSPLQNLNKDSGMGDFTTDKLNYDYQTPVEMELVDEYDGSENIIINNDKKFPTLINSRFSVQENNTYLIPEHSGNSVTNIYNEDSFNIESSLLKLYDKIPTLTFNGITDGGSFNCGSYVFYFKYADSDNNLSNVVQESGIVQVHIGQAGTSKVRMGLENEQANKNIHFTLTNVDKGFDYVRVFYERTSSGQSQASATSYFMIDQNFPILNQVCDIFLTGEEAQVQITKSDLETEFADIQSAKTSAINSNILFLGNVSAFEQKYQDLQQIAWMICPRAITVANPIGSLSETYDFGDTGGCYYDVKNVYNYTGYWPDEYYRFGVVFVYNNNKCSNVYNIQGADLSKDLTAADFLNSDGEPYEQEPENYIFRENKMTNSKGVVRLPTKQVLKYEEEVFQPDILGIQFDLSLIEKAYEKLKRGTSEYKDLKSILKSYNIKGLFFVRQKRIPSIYAQGIVVGLTGKEHGCLPVLYRDSWKYYVTKSFLRQDDLLLQEKGSTIAITSKVTNKALFVPDAELQEATYNQIFTGQEFTLSRVYSTGGSDDDNDHYYINTCKGDTLEKSVSKVTAVQKDVKLLTDGETYFSSIAGDPSSPEKTSDVNLVWNKTVPQQLSASNSLVRGKWGYYVGISSDAFDYGDIVNIKDKGFIKNEKEQNLLEFQKRFNDSSLYSAVSSRINIDELEEKLTCFRGDCFPSLFTHKVMNNFIDPELPTNHKIIDPSCWADNYIVRCTATLAASMTSNLTSENEGFFVPEPTADSLKSKIVQWIMVILTGGIAKPPVKDKSVNDEQKSYANEIVTAFEVEKKKQVNGTWTDVDTDELKNMETASKYGHIKKLKPKTTESSSGINIKALFTPDDAWEMRGISSINRADVNAVSFAQWLTFPICSSMNLAFRDIDYSQATEEASMNKKRSFYPWDSMNIHDHQVESNAISHGAKKSIASVQKVAYQSVPFLKQEFFNRIYWSRPNTAQTFVNSYRMIFDSQFREYPKEYGSITKLVSLGNALLVVFQHGIMVLPVNTTPQSENESSPYLAFKSILPTNGVVINDMYGSMWKDSVIKSEYSNLVYGVDTVAKKIWRASAQGIELISDHKIQKFLNDYLKLSEFDYQEYLGHINVKTHYNAFKKDIMFTFYKDTPTKYELTEEQKNTIIEDFLEDKVCYQGPSSQNFPETAINKNSIKIEHASDHIKLIYEQVNEIKQGKVTLNTTTWSVTGKPAGTISQQLFYHSEYDKNNELFKLLCTGGSNVTFVPNKGYKVMETITNKNTGTKFQGFGKSNARRRSIGNIGSIGTIHEKVTWYNSNIFTLEDLTLPSRGGTVKFETTETEGNIFYASKFEEKEQRYYSRKGFVYSYDNKPITSIRPVEWKKGMTWSLCYNEETQKFVTFYDWTPLQSANIDNIYFSFDKDAMENTLSPDPDKQSIEQIIPQLKQYDKTSGNSSFTLVQDEDGGIEKQKQYKINKFAIDRAFSNSSIEYCRQCIKTSDTQSKIVWTQDLHDGKVLCFYTNTTAEVIIPPQGVKHIALCYSKPSSGNSVEYIVDSAIAQNYICHLIYKTDSKVGQSTIEVYSYDYLSISDPHTVKSKEVKKGDFNYYEYRDSNADTMELWKHGQAGLYDNQGKIKPTNWYGKPHEFNFEFIVNHTPEIQKIFNNLMIISNKTAPKKFEYEVVGEGYDWYIYKAAIGWINIHKDDLFNGNLDDGYKFVLTTPYKKLRDTYEDFPELFNFKDDAIITKLPYLQLQLTDQDGLFYDSDKDLSYWESKHPNNTTKENNYSLNSSETCLIEDDQLSEYKLHTESLANDMKKYGRVRGNMEYLEDLWKIEIRPVNFRYVYLDENKQQLLFSQYQEMRHRDKFIRVKVRYDGEDLALIQTIATYFDYSYA